MKESLVPFSLLLYLQLKQAKRELLKIGNEEGNTLTFGKENYSYGHVDVICINFNNFVLGIREMEHRERSVLVTSHTGYQRIHFILCECHVKSH